MRLRTSARLFLALICCAAVVAGQSRLPKSTLAPEVRALLEIERSAARSIEAIPDYVCEQTVRRTQLNAKSLAKMEKLLKRRDGNERGGRLVDDFSDVVRLETAVVDGEEIYSWPDGEFKPVPLSELVGFGLTATGSFASYARSLFVTKQGRIRFVGQVDGLLRYDYRVPQFRSGYQVTTLQGSATVGYEGSFWASAEDRRLTRITVEGVDLPPSLGLESLSVEIRYRPVDLDDESYVLPDFAKLTMKGWDGSLKTNEATFENCRKFGAVSEMSFEVVDEPVQPEPAAVTETFEVPAGVELHVRLLTPIDSETSRVGDELQASLRFNLEADGRVLAPKGSRLIGRLRRLHQVARGEDSFYAVSLEFSRLETDDAVARIETELVRTQAAHNVSRTLQRGPQISTTRRGSVYGIAGGDARDLTTIVEERDRGLADVDSFYVTGQRFTLNKGFAMTWRVTAPD